MIAEKNRLREADTLENRNRIQQIEKIRNMAVFQKYHAKEKSMSDFNNSMNHVSNIFKN